MVKKYLVKYMIFVLAIIHYVYSSEEKSQDYPTTGKYANFETNFDRIIGLGHNCATKGIINAYFNPDAPNNQTKKGHADLFDWTLISSYELLCEALDHKLSDILDVERINPENKVDIKYNIEWGHIVEHHTNDCVNSSVEGELNHEETYQETLRRNADRINGKIQYLVQKFINAKEHNTLYILMHPCLCIDLLQKIRDRLEFIRDGNKSFVLLYITPNKRFDDFENILIRQDTTSKCFADTNTTRFHEIMSEFRLEPDIWA